MLVTCCLIEVEKIIYTSADKEVFDKVTQKIMDKKTVQSAQLRVVWRLDTTISIIMTYIIDINIVTVKSHYVIKTLLKIQGCWGDT